MLMRRVVFVIAVAACGIPEPIRALRLSGNLPGTVQTMTAAYEKMHVTPASTKEIDNVYKADMPSPKVIKQDEKITAKAPASRAVIVEAPMSPYIKAVGGFIVNGLISKDTTTLGTEVRLAMRGGLASWAQVEYVLSAWAVQSKRAISLAEAHDSIKRKPGEFKFVIINMILQRTDANGQPQYYIVFNKHLLLSEDAAMYYYGESVTADIFPRKKFDNVPVKLSVESPISGKRQNLYVRPAAFMYEEDVSREARISGGAGVYEKQKLSDPALPASCKLMMKLYFGKLRDTRFIPDVKILEQLAHIDYFPAGFQRSPIMALISENVPHGTAGADTVRSLPASKLSRAFEGTRAVVPQGYQEATLGAAVKGVTRTIMRDLHHLLSEKQIAKRLEDAQAALDVTPDETTTKHFSLSRRLGGKSVNGQTAPVAPWHHALQG